MLLYNLQWNTVIVSIFAYFADFLRENLYQAKKLYHAYCVAVHF